MPKDTTKAATGKPAKPHPDFPLFPHASGRWAKKVLGKMHYFGPWRDPAAALKRWNREKDYLLEGRRPPADDADAPTLRDLVNRFLTVKESAQVSGELSRRTFEDYHRVCGRIVTALGKDTRLDDLGPTDFEKLRQHMGKTLGRYALGVEITRARVVFKFAFDSELVKTPMRYGQSFKRPTQKVLRQERHAKGERMFEADQIRAMLAQARPQLRAMIYLGINCAFGNADCGHLPLKALDLQAGWVTFPRPKTAVQRRIPLWPETVDALHEVLWHRQPPRPGVPEDLVFVTTRRMSWAKSGEDNPITKECVKLLKSLGLHRPGLAFYGLRHTFETIAGETKDQVAVNSVMGHADRSMAATYRERISDERLLAVTEHVRRWLFPAAN